MAALLALDGALGRQARYTRDPVLAQLRLAWWRDALEELGKASSPADPILRDLAETVLPKGVRGSSLVRLVDGWEALVADDLDEYARGRGAALFAAAGRLLGATDSWLVVAGEGWALADLALTSLDAARAAAARDAAQSRLSALSGVAASRPARPLAALALSARMSLRGMPKGSPRRVARLLLLRFTGR